MADPIKIKINQKGKVNKYIKSSKNEIKFSLPEEPTIPSENLIDYSFLIYGRKKIGKTSLVSKFPKTILFMFEPGTKSLGVYKVPVSQGCFTNWYDVKGYVESLEKNKHDFITTVFDPGNKAYDLCLKYVCKTEGIQHPGRMKDYGASWKLVSDEFENIHLQLANINMAFIVIAHEKIIEYTGEDKKTYTRVIPKFSPSTEDFYEGIIDNIFYYHYIGNQRFLQIRGTEDIVAGTRCENNFKTINGEDIFKIPMGNSSIEAWENLQKAWNNQQKHSYREKEDKPKSKRKLILKSK